MLKKIQVLMAVSFLVVLQAHAIRVYNMTAKPMVAGIFYTFKGKFCPGTQATVFIVEKYTAQDIELPAHKDSIAWTLVVTPPAEGDDKIAHMRDFVNNRPIEQGDSLMLGTEGRNFYVINRIVEVNDSKHGASTRKVRKMSIMEDKSLEQLNEAYNLKLSQELLQPGAIPVVKGFSFVIEQEPLVETKRSRGSTVVAGAGAENRKNTTQEVKRRRESTVTQRS